MLQEEQTEIAVPVPEDIRHQLASLLADKAFRSSRRSSEFLRYVVEQTLHGAAENIKERTIGVEVFGRQPSYDTATDHVVRTAAIDVRKRLAMYYANPDHSNELRMLMVPGSYVPQFSYPLPEVGVTEPLGVTSEAGVSEPEPVQTEATSVRRLYVAFLVGSVAMLLVVGLFAIANSWRQSRSAEYLFWKPLFTVPGPVLLATGDIPSGPPTVGGMGVPVIQRGSATELPLADAITVARVMNALQSRGQRVEIRPEIASSFSDLKQSPSILIGAFNNEWSLRLTHPLRYSLELDPERHLIYIRDAEHPQSRQWSQVTGSTIEQQQVLRGGPVTRDYALITRVRIPETGQVAVVLGGLYAYGTEAAGDFITDPKLMQQLAGLSNLGDADTGVQIVLETTVTDETPGVPRVLALNSFK